MIEDREDRDVDEATARPRQFTKVRFAIYDPETGAEIEDVTDEIGRLRAIEAAARAWYEADRAYVEAPFGEDEEEQAVAHVAKEALATLLSEVPSDAR